MSCFSRHDSGEELLQRHVLFMPHQRALCLQDGPRAGTGICFLAFRVSDVADGCLSSSKLRRSVSRTVAWAEDILLCAGLNFSSGAGLSFSSSAGALIPTHRALFPTHRIESVTDDMNRFLPAWSSVSAMLWTNVLHHKTKTIVLSHDKPCFCNWVLVIDDQ